MTTIIPITWGAPYASRNASAPCPVFGHTVQRLEQLLAVDEIADDVPHGDPAYATGSAEADMAFEQALWAAERASYEASQSPYRAASDLIVFALRAVEGQAVRDAVMAFEGLVRDELGTVDRTVRLSLERCSAVLGDLAQVWDIHDAQEADERIGHDGLYEDVRELTPEEWFADDPLEAKIGRASCRERLVWCRSRWSPYH